MSNLKNSYFVNTSKIFIRVDDYFSKSWLLLHQGENTTVEEKWDNKIKEEENK